MTDAFSSKQAQRCFWGGENLLHNVSAGTRLKERAMTGGIETRFVICSIQLCACTRLAQWISTTNVEISLEEKVVDPYRSGQLCPEKVNLQSYFPCHIFAI